MSLSNREICRAARVNLTGVYRLGITAFLLANIASFAMQLPFQALETNHPTTTQQVISLVVTILIALLTVLLGVGQCFIHLQLAKESVTTLPNPAQVFYCFKHHPDRYLLCAILMGLMYVLCLIPSGVGFFLYIQNEDTLLLGIFILLIIVSLLAIAYVTIRFAFAFLLLLEQEDLSVTDSFMQSLSLTKGHEGQLFLLLLAFVGYNVLVILTLGLAALWVVPYEYQIISVCYLDLTGAFTVQPAHTPTIDIVIE